MALLQWNNGLLAGCILVIWIIVGLHSRRIRRLEQEIANIRRVFTIEQSMERIATILERPKNKGPDGEPAPLEVNPSEGWRPDK